MGILFNTNTWRRPLRMIDSWLPVPEPRSSPLVSTPSIQAFTRAGWLVGSARNRQEPISPVATSAPASRTCHVRLVRAPEPGSVRRPDARLVLSGRIGDVCAELDRLAALEQNGRLRS